MVNIVNYYRNSDFENLEMGTAMKAEEANAVIMDEIAGILQELVAMT